MPTHPTVQSFLCLLLSLLLYGISVAWLAPAVRSSTLPDTHQALVVASAPDLLVESITLNPPNPGVGGVADITVVIKNQGDADAAGFTVYLYVEAADDPPTQGTTATAQTFYGLTLPPNGLFTWKRTEQPFTTAQPVIYAWVDPPWENRIVEANEENNLARLPTVATPTPTATPTTVTTPTPTATHGPSNVYLAMIVNLPPPVITPTDTPTPTATATPLPVWRRVDNGGVNVAVLAATADDLFAGERRDTHHSGGLYSRQRAACAATPAFTRLVGVDSTVAGIAFAGAQGVFSAYDLGLFFSQDSGHTWLPAADAVVHPGAVTASSTGLLYAGAQDGGVYQSNDGGNHWRFLEEWTPRAINLLKFAGETLWIGTETGVWQLPPGAAAPIEQSTGLPAGPGRQVWDLAFTNANTFYLATFQGVYQGDGVNPWQPWGLQGRELYSLALAGDFLYAGARPSATDPAKVAGVWRRPLAGGDWEPVTATAAGWQESYIVRDLLYDSACQGLLAATDDGVWILQ